MATVAALPNVLVIVIEHMAMKMPLHLWPALKEKAAVTFATTAEKALAHIQAGNLKTIILADPAISKECHGTLLKEVTRYAQTGGRVIMCCLFSNFISPPVLNNLLQQEWGLPWRYGDYHRTDFYLNPARVNMCPNPHLPNSYSMKAVSLQSVELASRIYCPTRASTTQSNVFPSQPVTDTTQAAVAFTKIDQGWLGYIGDVNAEEESTTVVLAMAGLLSDNGLDAMECENSTGAEQGGRSINMIRELLMPTEVAQRLLIHYILPHSCRCACRT